MSRVAPTSAESDEEKKRRSLRALLRLRSAFRFHTELANANPLTSRFWFVVKHPLARAWVAFEVLLLNLWIYFGDPGSYSNSECYTTGAGNIYHGFFEADRPAYVAPRLAVMLVAGVATR